MSRLRPQYRVRQAPEGDSGWEKAESLTDFRFPWLDREAPRTEFRAWWSEGWLYFRFVVVDDDLVLDESGVVHEDVLGSDRVEIFVSPTADLSEPYYGMEMEPRGGIYDYRGVFHRQFDDSWKMPGLSTEGIIREGEGYTVSGKMPLQELRNLGCLKDDGTMVAGVYRAEFSHAEDGAIIQDWISWVDPETGKPDFHVPASFGIWVFESEKK